jgi:hypothetical protein
MINIALYYSWSSRTPLFFEENRKIMDKNDKVSFEYEFEAKKRILLI